MTDVQLAANRIKRIREGVEKSQDIYGIKVDTSSLQGIREAGNKVKRLMLDDERLIIDTYLAEHDSEVA
jgi:hypothetical protein